MDRDARAVLRRVLFDRLNRPRHWRLGVTVDDSAVVLATEDRVHPEGDGNHLVVVAEPHPAALDFDFVREIGRLHERDGLEREDLAVADLRSSSYV
jgi:hypothetical protein